MSAPEQYNVGPSISLDDETNSPEQIAAAFAQEQNQQQAAEKPEEPQKKEQASAALETNESDLDKEVDQENWFDDYNKNMWANQKNWDDFLNHLQIVFGESFQSWKDIEKTQSYDKNSVSYCSTAYLASRLLKYESNGDTDIVFARPAKPNASVAVSMRKIEFRTEGKADPKESFKIEDAYAMVLIAIKNKEMLAKGIHINGSAEQQKLLREAILAINETIPPEQRLKIKGMQGLRARFSSTKKLRGQFLLFAKGVNNLAANGPDKEPEKTADVDGTVPTHRSPPDYNPKQTQEKSVNGNDPVPPEYKHDDVFDMRNAEAEKQQEDITSFSAEDLELTEQQHRPKESSSVNLDAGKDNIEPFDQEIDIEDFPAETDKKVDPEASKEKAPSNKQAEHTISLTDTQAKGLLEELLQCAPQTTAKHILKGSLSEKFNDLSSPVQNIVKKSFTFTKDISVEIRDKIIRNQWNDANENQRILLMNEGLSKSFKEPSSPKTMQSDKTLARPRTNIEPIQGPVQKNA